MALKPYFSFSSGELDPILHDNVTLEKFNKGLATARNVLIGKTGSILSRFPRRQSFKTKLSGRKVKLYRVPNSDYLLEWGHQYVRIRYGLEFGPDSPVITTVERAHALLESDLPNIHFVTSKNFVFIFCKGKTTLKLQLNFLSTAFIASGSVFSIPNVLSSLSVLAFGAPSGYEVDYLATIVINGEESTFEVNTTGFNKPIAVGQSNLITTQWVTAGVPIAQVSEVRFYSRPHDGGAYGYLGSSTKFTISGLNTLATFQDNGELPDYTNGVPDLITKYGLSGDTIISLNGKTGAFYQQRLLITAEDDEEALLASRPGYINNFFRDFPYSADSALLFKAGTSGRAKVLRIVDSEGLIVFTSNGVYTNTGLLSINNLALERRGNWIINDTIPPLVVPGGVFFVDINNTIRQLVFSQQIMAYETLEQTIFSNHLFKDRTIETWTFQDGALPVIIVTFSDGTFATFTYSFEHQMRAWSRHDSKYPLEQVEAGGFPDVSYFVINKDGERYVEYSLPRSVPASIRAINPDFDKLPNSIFADGIALSGNNRPFEELEGINPFTMSPVTPNDWSGNLLLSYPDQDLDPLGPFIPGETYRFFHPVDKSSIDLLVISSNSFETIFIPSDEFPSDYADSPQIYRTFATISTGLSHLEGESVSVIVDGHVVASPNNDVENYPEIIVTGGAITLPDGMRGAIILIGRPIVADVKTLNISTVEQSPTTLESVNVNKLYVKLNDTRGLYCSNEFPEEKLGLVDGSSVAAMEDMYRQYIPKNNQIIGNNYPPAISRRVEKMLPGSWESQGQIAFRQVDPLHFEILSIIPDLTVLKRSDR